MLNISIAILRSIFVAIISVPLLAFAEPVVLVDAIPAGGELFNYAEVQVPFTDLDKVNTNDVEGDLAKVIASIMPTAKQNGVTYICLLSSPRDDARSFRIDAAHERLKLSAKNASFTVVLYRGGVDSPSRFAYSIDNPPKRRDSMKMSISMISMPAGWSTAAWLYFNLPKIQEAASRSGSTQIYLEASGRGAKSFLSIPGSADPLVIYSDDAKISASWNSTNPLTEGSQLVPTPAQNSTGSE